MLSPSSFAREDHQLLPLVLIEVLGGIFDVVGAEQKLRAGGTQGVDLQHLQIHRRLPAHRQLQPAVAVQILVVDAVDRGAAALDQPGLPVAVAVGGENVDFQRLFRRGIPEERHGFRPAVAVQIHQLDRLDIRAGGGRGIFRAVFQNGAEQLVQLRVLCRQRGEAVQLLGVKGQLRHAAAGKGQHRQQHGRQQQPPADPPHILTPPSAPDAHNSTHSIITRFPLFG